MLRKSPPQHLVFLWDFLLYSSLFLTTACSTPSSGKEQLQLGSDDPITGLLNSRSSKQMQASSLSTMGYTIQVGAFANPNNAAALERTLSSRGIDAYYFRHASGLYKVRFGNHATYGPARKQAERLQAHGLIDKFFIVFPNDHPSEKIRRTGRGELRSELVKTAKSFIGTPYLWGGTNAANGFDCSGLTMVSYRINGLNLPRVSNNQYKAGKGVAKSKLQPGDLVFFATQGGKRVTHVGLYIGKGKFIHAPRTGKKVRVESLSNAFYAKTFVGGRSYI